MKHDNPTEQRSFWLTWQGLSVLALGAAMLYFLLTEHTAHTLTILPWAIFLLCPVMHLFMHKGHGGHGGHKSPPAEPTADPAPEHHTSDTGHRGHH